MAKVLKDASATIVVADEEFHCPGAFGPMHKGRPNDADMTNIKEFAKRFK